MTADQYRAALVTLGQTQMGFAEWLGCHPMTGKRWAAKGPHPAVAKLVQYLVAQRLSPNKIDYAITGKRRPRQKIHELKQRAA